ncbi:MAG TPA: serine/threonine-protein kinase [Blastocatellia bacterium]|nr:serine/threonine-protein kinase [Blastocatellia bacterium]
MAEHWKQIEELFHRALQLEPGERQVFLDEACGADRKLRAEVESLLVSDGQAEQEEKEVQRAIHRVAEEFVEEGSLSEGRRRIGPYELVEELGRGGMGAVYLGQRADESYQKQVAIKLIKRGMDTDEVLARFRHERQILANLDHPNIARLLDGGTTEDGLPYFVMEHIEGQPIDQYCATRELSIFERLKLFRTVCSAVSYAHQNLVVHRDLKPGNILVTADGVVKLLDFGIAKLLHAEPGALTLTATAIGLRAMTPEYASPEQVRGETMTTASDVYSLGVLLYELLTGRRPYQFKGSTPLEIERVITVEEPPKPSTAVSRQPPVVNGRWPVEADDNRRWRDGHRTAKKLSRQLEGDLDNIVLMAIRKDPQRRYASVEQFSEDIRRHLAGRPVIARTDTLGYRAGKFVKRHRVGVGMAAAVLSLMIAIGAILAAQSARIARERDRAVAAEQVAAQQRTAAESERDRAIAAERVSERARDAERTQHNIAEANLARAQEAERQATSEAARANNEAARARTEAETARRVSEFLAGLFEVSDPSRAKGNTITAREILDKGAARITKDLKGQPKVQATMMDTMGRVYESLGLYDSAAPLHDEALKLRRQTLGAEHVEVARSLNNLAEVLRRKGDHETAESLYREALAMQRKLLGPEHADVAESLDNLAILLDTRGDYKAAEQLFREALEMRRKLLGREHAEVCETLNNLGELLRKKGDYEAAEPLFRDAIAIQRKQLGSEDPRLAITLDNLASLLYSKGDYVAAEPLYREALGIFRKVLGNEHPDVAINLNNLATLRYAKGDYDGAEPLYREALATYRKLLGEEHPNLGNIMHNLARTLHAKGDYAAADPLYRRALDLRRRKLREGHPDIAHSLVGFGLFLTDKGTPLDAEPLLREGLEIRRKAFSAGDWRTAEAQSVLGGCLAALKRYDEAEPLLVESYATLKAKRGDRDRTTQQTLKRLISLYEAWGKSEKAAPYRALLAQSDSSPK